MDVAEGSYRLGPHCGRLLVRTGRSGPGAKAGHDLTLEATRWDGSVAGSGSRGGDRRHRHRRRRLTRDPGGDRRPQGAHERRQRGDRTDMRKVLDVERHRAIVFRSERVTVTAGSFTAEGELTVTGVPHPLTVSGTISGGRARGSATVTQSAWGIKPFSAFFGALKVRDEVEVSFDLDAGAASAAGS